MAAKHAESDKATTHTNGAEHSHVDEQVHHEAAFDVDPSAEELAVEGNSDFASKAAIVGVIGVGAALIEASLIPGIIVGAAAVLAPKLLPGVGSRLRPLFKSTVRGAYKLTEKTREAFAEAQEQVQDIMAEARHEKQEAVTGAPAPKAANEVHAAAKA